MVSKEGAWLLLLLPPDSHSRADSYSYIHKTSFLQQRRKVCVQIRRFFCSVSSVCTSTDLTFMAAMYSISDRQKSRQGGPRVTDERVDKKGFCASIRMETEWKNGACVGADVSNPH